MTDIQALTEKLFIAINEGDCCAVEELLNQGADLEGKNNYDNTPLYEGVYSNQLLVVECLLNKGAEVNAKGEKGKGPLIRAVLNNNEAMVKLLLAHNANTECQTQRRETPLHIACDQANYTLTQLLLDKQANVHAQDEYGRTPLHIAARHNETNLILSLLKSGAKIKALDIFQRTALHEAASYNAKWSIQSLFLMDANLEAKDNKARTPLHLAYREAAKHAIKLLERLGADKIARDKEGYDPLTVGQNHKLYQQGKSNTQQALKRQSLQTSVKKINESKSLLKMQMVKTTDNNNAKNKTVCEVEKSLQAYLLGTIEHIIVNFYNQQAYWEAINKFEQVKELLFTIIKPDEPTPELASLYYHVGSTYLKLVKHSIACRHLKKTSVFHRILYGEQHAATLKVRERLDHYYIIHIADKCISAFLNQFQQTQIINAINENNVATEFTASVTLPFTATTSLMHATLAGFLARQEYYIRRHLKDCFEQLVRSDEYVKITQLTSFINDHKLDEITKLIEETLSATTDSLKIALKDKKVNQPTTYLPCELSSFGTKLSRIKNFNF